jgi:hypothetical protein
MKIVLDSFGGLLSQFGLARLLLAVAALFVFFVPFKRKPQSVRRTRFRGKIAAFSE